MALLLLTLFSISNTTTASSHFRRYNPLLVNVILNYQDLRHITLALYSQDNRVFITGQELRLWHIRLPSQPSMRYHGSNFYLLDDIPQLHYHTDRQSMRLSVHAPPSAFLPTQIDATPTEYKKAQRNTGAFVNYYLDYTHTPQNTGTNGLIEAGLFNRYGAGISDFLWKGPEDQAQQLVRLNSTWTADFPSTLSTLHIGDTVNAPSLWGRQVNFAGIQWQTNFATRPDFSPYPLLEIHGDALMPSVAELYINNTRTFRSNLSSGSFSINAIPHITGAGEVQLVTTDLLGKQHTLRFPFYASHNLLRPGLHQYSYSLGLIRQDFSMYSNRYHRLLALGTDTIGITPNFTTQWHAEIIGHQVTLGIGAQVLHNRWGVFTGATALSYQGHHFGALTLLGFEHSSPKWNLHLQGTMTSTQFREIGLDPTETPNPLQAQAFLGLPLPGNTSMGLGWIYQKKYAQQPDQLFTVSYGGTFAQQWHLNVSAFTHFSSPKNHVLMLTLTHRLSRNTSLNLSANYQDADHYNSLALQKNLPADHGWGYEFRTDSGDSRRYWGTLHYRSSTGTYSVEAEKTEDFHYLLSTNGGIAWMGGHAYLTQPLGDSFALVQVPGYQGIDIYYNHKNMGHTDSKGNLLITNLSPYTANIVALNPAQIPLNVKIENLSLSAIPYFRSGMILRFPIKRAHDAVFTLLQPNGTPVPAHATVILQDKRSFPVAYNGQVYITELKTQNTLTAHWGRHHCQFALNIPAALWQQPLPHLGEIRCNMTVE